MLIQLEELTPQKIVEVFQSAFVPAEVDGDGDARIETPEGFRVWMNVNEGAKLLVVFALARLKDGTPRIDGLEFCQKINAELNFIRACLSDDGTRLVLDQATSLAGGITPEEMVTLSRLMGKRLAGMARLDTGDILA